MSLRGEHPTCIACETALELVGPRWSCERCGCVMISDDAVTEMMTQIAPDDPRPVAQRLVARTGEQRQCPHCATMMDLHELAGVVIDRCPEHGIWFDPGELMTALHANASDYAQRNPSPHQALTFLGMVHSILGPWLARRRLKRQLGGL